MHMPLWMPLPVTDILSASRPSRLFWVDKPSSSTGHQILAGLQVLSPSGCCHVLVRGPHAI